MMLVVMVLERVPPSLRGDLTRWMLEPRSTVFVGDLNPDVRDRLWKRVCRAAGTQAGCLMVRAAPTEQGFMILSHGSPSRLVEDFDGLQLIRTR
jgi:CRISPR-associated protein Cas2